MVKIVNITNKKDIDGTISIIATCDDGSIWQRFEKDEWVQLSDSKSSLEVELNNFITSNNSNDAKATKVI